MKKFILVSTFILLWPLAGIAQDVPKYEISGGFSDLGERQQIKTQNYPGWYATFARNFNNWLAVETEFSGHYSNFAGTNAGVCISGSGCSGTVTTTPLPNNVSVHGSDHLFLAGPRFSYRGGDRVTLFAHALVGARYDKTSVSVAQVLASNSIRTSFAVGTGGGVDVNITKSFSIRTIQADYIHTGNPLLFDRNDFRLSTGVIFRFGK